LASRVLSTTCPNNQSGDSATDHSAMMETIINHGRPSDGAAVSQ
jgi:hypothetical protein